MILVKSLVNNVTLNYINTACVCIGDDFLTCYCDSVLKFLPDIKTIISLRQLLSNADQIKVPADAKNEFLHKEHETKNTGKLLAQCAFVKPSHFV